MKHPLDPKLFFAGSTLLLVLFACSKKKDPDPGPGTTPSAPIMLTGWSLNGQADKTTYYDIGTMPVLRLRFNGPVNRSTVAQGVSLSSTGGTPVNVTLTYLNGDSTVQVMPAGALANLEKYRFSVAAPLAAVGGGGLQNPTALTFLTSIDSSRKFPVISDDSLLSVVQRQTFKYFWDFGHPVSGLARERNTSGDVVTSGGSGFGVMAIITGIHRGFISRAQGLARLQTMVGFLRNTAQTHHGAFPHWLNGATGATVAFSANDNGADLVETSYLVQGLLCVRQYFTGAGAEETSLRNSIDTIWRRVEWNWFRKGGENTLYWHWSPTVGWAMNMQVRGWNEALITYALGAASPTYSIRRVVYDNGWAANGGIRNGQTYYNQQLQVGPAMGGPLFFAHYSFLGLNPDRLQDAYASNYFNQNKAHSLIHYNYSIANPQQYFGYSDSVWGLTASDVPGGYRASSPTSDIGVVAPTAALSSFPYTPTESMKALKFYYYVLGDKLFKEYGFVDAFSLREPWFASSFLAIDQGPIIVMIENYRSGLLWNLFMSAPEVKSGLLALGFQSPHI